MNKDGSIGAWGDLCVDSDNDDGDEQKESDNDDEEEEQEDWRNLGPSPAKDTGTGTSTASSSECTTATAQQNTECQHGHGGANTATTGRSTASTHKASDMGKDIDTDVVVVEEVPSDKRGDSFKQEVLAILKDDVKESMLSIVWHSVDVAVIVVPTCQLGKRLLEGLHNKGYQHVSYYFARASLPPPKSEKEANSTDSATTKKKGPSQRLLMGALGGRRALSRTANDNTLRAVQVARNDIRIAFKQSDDVDSLSESLAKTSITAKESEEPRGSASSPDTKSKKAVEPSWQEDAQGNHGASGSAVSKHQDTSPGKSKEHCVLIIENVPSEMAGTKLESHLSTRDPSIKDRISIVWHSVDVAALVAESDSLGETLYNQLSKDNFEVRYFDPSEQLPAPKTQTEAKTQTPQKKDPARRMLMGALGGKRSLAKSASENTKRSIQLAKQELRHNNTQK